MEIIEDIFFLFTISSISLFVIFSAVYIIKILKYMKKIHNEMKKFNDKDNSRR